MHRLSIPACLISITLALLSGCAGKTKGDLAAAPAEVAVTEAGIEAASAGGVAVQNEPLPAPASATLSTLDGRKLDTVYFDYDSFTLQPPARQALERNAAWLQANPTTRITIEGHCDERGSDEYNLALGERRALAVKGYLTALGIAGERLATVSYGEERPVVAGHDESAWAKNRRAEFK
jgi:peptidoglycan-associated lipoprotein